jgi:hypothetical protein
MADQFHIGIEADGTCADPLELCPQDQAPDVRFGGQSEALLRLLGGYDPQVPGIFQNIAGLTDDQVTAAVAQIATTLGRPVVAAPMPIQDAVQLTSFLVDVSIRFSHFTPGASTVGGPIELAAITKHEGFKWIQRKYYYDRRLNPEEEHDA